MRLTAENKFHGKEKYNCAQAILSAFQDSYGVPADTILEHKKSGGGRAEGNMCGAIYAATLLEQNSSVQENLTSGFIKEAGSLRCKDIRKSKTLSCLECVGVAAELLEKESSKRIEY